MAGFSTGARGLISKASGSAAGVRVGQALKNKNVRMAAFAGTAAATGYASVNAYSNDRDASQVNMYGASLLGGVGGAAAVMRNRSKQGQSLFTRPGSVNNHLFPGGGDQGIG